MAVAAAALSCAPQIACAQTSDADEIAAIKAQINQLSQRLEKLEEREAARDQPNPAQPATGPSKPAPTAANAASASPTVLAGAPPTVAPAPVDRALKPAGASGFQLDASSSGSQVSVSASTQMSPLFQRTGWWSGQSWSVTLSAPASKGGGSTAVATLDGLANGTSATIQWTGFAYPFSAGNARSQQIARTALANCIAHPLSDADKAQCVKGQVDDTLVANYDKNEEDAYRHAFFTGPAIAFGVQGGVGYNSYNYLNATTVKQATADRDPLSAKAFISLIPVDGEASFTASYTYQRAYNAATSGVLCPVTAATVLKCQSGALGPPTESDQNILAFEARKLFPTSIELFPNVAISAQFEHDFHTNDNAVDVPVYLVSDTKGNLIGGLRFGYTTAMHTTVGIFVDAPFTVFQSLGGQSDSQSATGQ